MAFFSAACDSVLIPSTKLYTLLTSLIRIKLHVVHVARKMLAAHKLPSLLAYNSNSLSLSLSHRKFFFSFNRAIPPQFNVECRAAVFNSFSRFACLFFFSDEKFFRQHTKQSEPLNPNHATLSALSVHQKVLKMCNCFFPILPKKNHIIFSLVQTQTNKVLDRRRMDEIHHTQYVRTERSFRLLTIRSKH